MEANYGTKSQVFSWKAVQGALSVGERFLSRQLNLNLLCAKHVWQLTTFAMFSGHWSFDAGWKTFKTLHCVPLVGITSGSKSLVMLGSME